MLGYVSIMVFLCLIAITGGIYFHFEDKRKENINK